MARRYSRYRKYSRRYRSRGTGRSRAISNMKSAYQQKDNASVVLNVQRNIACKKNGLDSPWNAGERDVAVLNIYDCLAHSEMAILFHKYIFNFILSFVFFFPLFPRYFRCFCLFIFNLFFN